MKNLNWDDVRIFLHVARAGGLTAAAGTTGLSAPTIGRRITALEQCLGRVLFERSKNGYRLTKDGYVLMDKALAMDAGMRPIAEWSAEGGERPMLRISAGSWTAQFLAENFAKLWTPQDDFRICFRTTEARLDLAHREAEIGLRNRRPETGNLAARQMGVTAFAAYRARDRHTVHDEGWVTVGADEAVTDSARWVLEQPGLTINACANTPRTLHDLIRAGTGKGVLPCFAGDRDPRLERCGPLIADLEQEQWLVTHADDRHRPEVRPLIDRIVTLTRNHAALYRGDRPIGAASEAPA